MTQPIKISALHKEVILSIIRKMCLSVEYKITSNDSYIYIKIQCPNCDLNHYTFITDFEFNVSTYGVCTLPDDNLTRESYSDHIIISLSDPELIAKSQEYLDHSYMACVRTYAKYDP